jgi:hypothetical protein
MDLLECLIVVEIVIRGYLLVMGEPKNRKASACASGAGGIAW